MKTNKITLDKYSDIFHLSKFDLMIEIAIDIYITRGEIGMRTRIRMLRVGRVRRTCTSRSISMAVSSRFT